MLTQLIANGLIAGVWIALLAVGFSVLYAGSRFFVFSYGISYTFGAYGMLACSHVMPLPIAAVLGVGVGSAVGLVLELTIYRHIRRRGENALVLMLASIGAYACLQNVVSLTFGDATQSVRSWEARPGFLILGAYVTSTQVLIVCASIAALLIVVVILSVTGLGRQLRAIAKDVTLAQTVGLPVKRIIGWSAVVGGGMGGLAGVLMSLDTDMVPTMGFNALLLGIVACVVGGITRVRGPIVGGLFVGLVQHIGVWQIPTIWQGLVLFVILILFLLLRPQGFLGKPVRSATV